MWVEAEHIPIYLANDTTSLASREGTFDKALHLPPTVKRGIAEFTRNAAAVFTAI